METGTIDRHLCELGQDRERKAVRTALALPFSDSLWSSLGIYLPNAWFILEINTRRLVGNEPEAECPGDIDIIAGRLKPSLPESELEQLASASRFSPFLVQSYLAQRGPIGRTLSLDYLVGIEARACIWKQPGEPRGFKQRREEYRRKSRGIIDLGFDRAMLIHLIAIEPHVEPKASPWFQSVSEAARAEEKLRQNPFSSDGDPFGEAIWSFGSVKHKLEFESGAGGPRVIQPSPPAGPQATRQRELRSRIEERLHRELSNLKLTGCAPVFLQWHRNGMRIISKLISNSA